MGPGGVRGRRHRRYSGAPARGAADRRGQRLPIGAGAGGGRPHRAGRARRGPGGRGGAAQGAGRVGCGGAELPQGPRGHRRVSAERVVAAGRRVLGLEAQAVSAAATALDDRFARAVELLRAGSGRVIVTGVGKSGLIARKIAATLTSTGTQATWLHPVDSLHGDLGLVGPADVAIVLSKSGETDELVGLLGALQRLQVPIIALTGSDDSVLTRAAAVVLDAGVAEEACPHDLAPTSSTTVALALGDALAVALLEEKGFAAEDFARLHPGGRLGRRLLLRVRDVMLPPGELLAPHATIRDAVVALAQPAGLAVGGRGGGRGGEGGWVCGSSERCEGGGGRRTKGGRREGRKDGQGRGLVSPSVF